MKKMKRITESDLNRIVKKIILEMYNFSDEKLSSEDWEKIWFKLRKISKSFAFPEASNNYFNFGGLEFNYNEDDGSLELNSFLRDPYTWRDEYDKGVEVLEKYAEKIENFIEESGLDIQFEMGPKFSMKISKK
jgi:hypothetical protein